MNDGVGHMNESILVCVYYGPNGRRLIKRGHQLAKIIECPLYVLTVDELPYDEFDEKRSRYIDEWRELARELDVKEFILLDNEKRNTAKGNSDFVHQTKITHTTL